MTLDDIEPKIWRRLEVPLSSSLRGVHDAIQAVMLFEDRHLFMFEQGNGDQRKRYGLPDRFQDSYFQLQNARSTKLGALVDRGITRLTYTYDFGDDWRHTIEVEASNQPTQQLNIRALSKAHGQHHPKTLAVSLVSRIFLKR